MQKNYEILLGDLRFDSQQIASDSISLASAVDVAGSELSVDVFSVVVAYELGADIIWTPKDYDGVLTSDGYIFGSASTADVDLSETPYGTPVRFYEDGGLHSKFYVKNIVRVGRKSYKINAMSPIGFLDKQRHNGGVYSRSTVAAVLTEIIGDTFNYSVDSEVGSQQVDGWLPIDTGRSNLHRLMFALGFSVTKDANGDVRFTFLKKNAPVSVPDSRIFIGGSVDYSVQATSAEVVEHSFYKGTDTEAEEIFTNYGGVTADHLPIEFSDPYYDLESDTLTLDESGDNYAIVSGIGTLIGKRYVHGTKTIRRDTNSSSALVPNVVRSDADTLVNALNSNSVVKRLAAFYGSRRTVGADLILNGEKAGDVIRFNDAFGDEASGIIAQMEISASSFLRANCSIVTDYAPTGQGNYYTRRKVVKTSGTITLPRSATNIRLVLVQGGEGGQGGYDGEHGRGGNVEEDGDLTYIADAENIGFVYSGGNQEVPVGGAAGEAGAAGKVYVADITVEPQTSIDIVVGAGGTGGERGGGYGSSGGETTATIDGTTYSSADGQGTSPYVDLFTGDIYSLPGETGHAGGNGGQSDVYSLYGVNGEKGIDGNPVADNIGGAGGAGFHDEWQWPYPYEDITKERMASGGGGGGAAYGANGHAGFDGRVEEHEGVDVLIGGAGGAGANAYPPVTPRYGCGGGGGNGGGGGGNAGGCHIVFPRTWDDVSVDLGGVGGTGSRGGHGGAGVCIIYY